MKRLVLIALLVSGFAFAQHPGTFKMNSAVLHERQVDEYFALIIVSEDLAYSTYDSPKNYQTIKEEYFNKLRNNGINTDMLKEDKQLYYQYGYRKDGSTFLLETKDKDTFFKLLSVTADGVNIYEKNVIFKPLTDTKVAELSKKAIEAAMSRAKIVAAGAGKKIGRIIELSHTPYDNIGNYYNKDYLKQNFSVSITFELTD